MNSEAPAGGAGLVVIQRLHRMVRHGYRPWLGYDVASGQDRDIQLHDKTDIATIGPDGSVSLTARAGGGRTVIAGDEHAGFDARFPPNAPNKRNLIRRLYEIGF